LTQAKSPPQRTIYRAFQDKSVSGIVSALDAYYDLCESGEDESGEEMT